MAKRWDLKRLDTWECSLVSVRKMHYFNQSLPMFFTKYTIHLLHLLVAGVNEARSTDSGPLALTENIPVTVCVYVVTTKMYLRPSCRVALIRNWLLLPASSSQLIKF
jgi:hypothetical protein